MSLNTTRPSRWGYAAWACLLLCLLMPTWASASTPVELENARPGSAAWHLTNPAEYGEIEGYASLTSVNRGKAIKLFVNTHESSYTIEIYRMGWYGGAGARRVVGPIERPGTVQAIPEPDPETGLIECRWTDPYELTTANPSDPRDWLSGIYLAKLTTVSGKQSYIIFVVREDERPSDYLYQSSVTTFQAYNNWGGKSLYQFNSVGRAARKVSFNRPYAPSENPVAAFGGGAGEFLTNNSPGDRVSSAGWEYNMVRWLEREGYDVTYCTNVDTHADPTLLMHHRGWLSVGHDEYWSWEMRDHVKYARDHGVSLAFFSANVCYWQIRFEPSLMSGDRYRTIVSYKEDPEDEFHEDPYVLDRDPTNDHRVTSRWRRAPVNSPEEALLGVMYEADPVDSDVVIANAGSWVTSGTGLRPADHLPGLLGYEVDRVFGSGPGSVTVVAHSPYTIGEQPHYSDLVFYEWPSGATVFATGSIQWSWGLDDFNVPLLRTSRLHAGAQQMTRNVLARLAGDHFPVAAVSGPTEGRTGVPLSFNGRSSSDEDGGIVGYQWTYGDGTSEKGPATTHVYRSPGRYTVTLTVMDDRGARHSTSRELSIHE
ncbi:N,N-dimethylformamidase beta subunit family domain-containing protein [Nitrospira sp. Nam74]